VTTSSPSHMCQGKPVGVGEKGAVIAATAKEPLMAVGNTGGENTCKSGVQILAADRLECGGRKGCIREVTAGPELFTTFDRKEIGGGSGRRCERLPFKRRPNRSRKPKGGGSQGTGVRDLVPMPTEVQRKSVGNRPTGVAGRFKIT